MAVIREVVERRWREPDEGTGQFAVNDSTSPFPKSLLGPPSTVQSSWQKRPAARHPLSGGAACAMRSTPICAPVDSTRERNSFVQYYGATGLDASLLLIPVSGFLPPEDPRVLGTIDAIQRKICSGPFVWRYSTDEGVDGLAGSEGAFLICSFWLVNALALADALRRRSAIFNSLWPFKMMSAFSAKNMTPWADACWATFHRPSRISDCCIRFSPFRKQKLQS